MPGALTPRSPCRGLALALLLCSPCAAAVGLGEIEVRSALGQVLDARIPLALEPGKAVDASCFSLMRGARDEAVPTLVTGALTLERSAGAAVLRILSPVRVSEPALALRIRAACPGHPDQDERQYTVLLDPQPGAEGVIALPVVGASLAARPGDTLASIAAQVIPGDRAARSQYLAALREANPALAGRGDALLPAGEEISLPDLRTYARGRAAVPRPTAPAPVASSAQPATPSAPATLPTPATPPPAPKPATAPAKTAPAKTALALASPAAAPKGDAASPFTLRLSSAEVDLTRSRGMDDRRRAQLRERLLLLDQDDHVAALLSLRHNVRQLESRVAELQLKLSTMPAALATAAPAAQAPAAQPSAAQPPAIQAPAQPAAQRPAAEIEPAWVEALSSPWMLGLLAILAALGLLAVVVRRRPRAAAADGEGTPSALLPTPPPPQAWPPAESDDAHAPWARPAMASDAGLATRLPEDSRELRRRYIEERFPEIAHRTLVIEDPSSVVKAARLFYEDGAIARAVELLKFSIEDNPAELRAWLALFEIYRLERLTDEFAALARRFHDHHGGSEYWRKVQYFGRELDPANPLYREDSAAALETIGPKQARRVAAATATAFDPVAENWLDAPLDFENEVLANELRQALMTRASIAENELAPNPIPALRSIEMFRVA